MYSESSEIMVLCLVLNEDKNVNNRFIVDIDNEVWKKKISHLQRLIKKEKENAFDKFDASDLELWKVSIRTKEVNGVFDEKLKILMNKSHMNINIKEELDGLRLVAENNIRDYIDENPDEGHILIIVKPPTTDLERKRKMVQDVSGQILDKLHKRPRMTLPKVESLKELIDKELPEEIKLPLTQREFDMLLSNDIDDICDPEDLRVLFRVSETESSLRLCGRILFGPILSKLPPSDGTEYSFVELWDANIRKPLEILVYNSTYVRNSSRNMSTGSERPDYGLILNQVCPFRGEEKSPSNKEDPKSELGSKLAWTYNPAPYVLGYYANGPLVTFVAICRPLEGHDVPNVINIVNSNLALRRERILHLRRIINLSIIIELVQEVIGFRETAEFIPIVREGRQIIMVCGKYIKKTYISPDAHDRVERLVNIYGKLVQKEVPNVDRLDYADKEKNVVYLSPKGMSVKPMNQQELLDSITCVLEMLVVLHGGEEPIYHQDIRWPNIICSALDASKWIVIDWEDADGYPNSPASHLTPAEHAPEVFRQNHGGEVDIWSVGKLITDASGWIIGLSQRITRFGRKLQEDDRPPAKKALKRFERLKKRILEDQER